jgi:hypothetical protein
MANFLNQQLTDKGWDALSTALGGGRLTFFKMQAGDGTIVDDSLIPPMTALVHPVCDVALVNYEIDGKGQITLFGNIASAQLDAGFTFRELGVFATIEPPTARGGVPPAPTGITAVVTNAPSTQANPVVPDPGVGVSLMYSYCNSYANSDYIPGKGETTDVVNSIQVTVKIDQAADVVINIIAGQQLSITNIGPPTVGCGPWSNTQANVAYMKRLVTGPGMLLTEDANTITIGEKVLTADLDLYVAVGNPDIAPNFSSIQKAHDYLLGYLIPVNRSATIHALAGLWTLNNAANYLYHPNASQISIIGAAPIVTTATAITNVSSAQFSITLTDASQFNVGDVFYLASDMADNKTAYAWRGGHQIQSKAGNVITVTKNNASGQDFTTSQVGLSCRCIKFPSVIQITGASQAFNCASGVPLRLVQNFTIISTDRAQNSRGVFNLVSNVTGVVAYNVEQGISVNGTSWVADVVGTSCTWGIMSAGGVMNSWQGDMIANGCIQSGIWCFAGASVSIGTTQPPEVGQTWTATAVMNANGIECDQAGNLSGGKMYVTNNAYGILCRTNGSIVLGYNRQPVSSWANRIWDLYADFRGFMNVTKNGGTINTSSPPSGVVGNDQAYITIAP